MVLQDISAVRAARVVDPGEVSLAHWRARFPRLHLDVGCGDARFALREARGAPDLGVVAIDTCLDNVRIPRRGTPANLRLIQADGRDIGSVPGLRGADRVTVNFPYGSLLRWIVEEETGFSDQVSGIVAPDGSIEIRINVSALREIGAAPDEVERRLHDTFARLAGWRVAFDTMGQSDLQAFPSTWARRIGFGRETTALQVTARRVG